jgi:hypothetical protein
MCLEDTGRAVMWGTVSEFAWRKWVNSINNVSENTRHRYKASTSETQYKVPTRNIETCLVYRITVLPKKRGFMFVFLSISADISAHVLLKILRGKNLRLCGRENWRQCGWRIGELSSLKDQTEKRLCLQVRWGTELNTLCVGGGPTDVASSLEKRFVT